MLKFVMVTAASAKATTNDGLAAIFSPLPGGPFNDTRLSGKALLSITGDEAPVNVNVTLIDGFYDMYDMYVADGDGCDLVEIGSPLGRHERISGPTNETRKLNVVLDSAFTLFPADETLKAARHALQNKPVVLQVPLKYFADWEALAVRMESTLQLTDDEAQERLLAELEAQLEADHPNGQITVYVPKLIMGELGFHGKPRTVTPGQAAFRTFLHLKRIAASLRKWTADSRHLLQDNLSFLQHDLLDISRQFALLRQHNLPSLENKAVAALQLGFMDIAFDQTPIIACGILQ